MAHIVAQAQAKKSKISRGEMLVAIVFNILFIAFIYYKPHLLGWYSLKNSDLTLVESLLVTARLQDYLPALISLALFQLLIQLIKFFVGKWTILIALINAGYNIALCFVYPRMAVDSSLFNDNFVDLLTEFFHAPETLWSQMTWVIAAFFILGCMIDSFIGFVRCRKTH